MFSLYDLGASLSLSPVPGDALPEVEFPPDVAEPLLDGVVPEAVAPEDAASGAAALETVFITELPLSWCHRYSPLSLGIEKAPRFPVGAISYLLFY